MRSAGSEALRRYIPGLLLAIVAVGVIGPLFFVLKSSFVVDGRLALSTFVNAWTASSVASAAFNTAIYTLITVPAAVVIGLGLAIAAFRLDSTVARLMPFMSLLMPPIVGAMGWVLLFAPRAGLVNVVWRDLVGSTAASGPFDIFTLSGVLIASIVFSVPFTYLFCLSALDNVDPTLEEAARISGASRWQTLRRVVIPLIMPGLSSAILLTTLLTMAEFSIPLIIGRPFGFWVLTMEIWSNARRGFPPDYAGAASIGSLLLFVAIVGIYVQRRILGRGSFATIAGRGTRNHAPLVGTSRVLALLVIWSYVALAVILPVAALTFVSLQEIWTPRLSLEGLSLANFVSLVDGSTPAQRAFVNSTILAVAAASLAILLTGLGSYVIVRTRGWAAALLDYVFMLPSGLPHSILGLGFLLFFLLGPLPLYGTMWALLFCYVILFLPHSSRASLTSMRQIAPELEEAGLISGASWWRTIRSITLPLARPGLQTAWTLVFILAFRELAASLFLSTRNTPVVSSYLAERWEYGVIPEVAAAGITVIAVSVLLVLAVNVGRRRGPRRVEQVAATHS